MTVCIATIARETLPDGTNSDVIIIAADRMITLGQTTEFVMGDITKSAWFTDKIVGLAADDINLVLEIFRDAYEILPDDKSEWTTSVVAEAVAAKFRTRRQKRAEEIVLSKYFLDHGSFIEKMNDIHPLMLQKIIQELDDGEAVAPATIIIAGVDGSTGYIYTIEDPGHAKLRQGFATIGIGASHADTVFTEAGYTEHCEWTKAVVLTYIAKKRAESAPGVSDVTDMYWIRQDGKHYVEPSAPLQSELSSIFHEERTAREKIVSTGQRKIKKKLLSFPVDFTD